MADCLPVSNPVVTVQICAHSNAPKWEHHQALAADSIKSDKAGNTAELLKRLNLILPDGQISESCPAPFAKIFLFSPDPNHFYIPRRPTPLEGRIAIVTDAGGMQWTRQRLARTGIAGRVEPRERTKGVRTTDAFRGRQSRVVLAPVAGAKFAEARRPDRVRQNLNPLMTVAT
jgi:hypothetical protein